MWGNVPAAGAPASAPGAQLPAASAGLAAAGWILIPSRAALACRLARGRLPRLSLAAEGLGSLLFLLRLVDFLGQKLPASGLPGCTGIRDLPGALDARLDGVSRACFPCHTLDDLMLDADPETEFWEWVNECAGSLANIPLVLYGVSVDEAEELPDDAPHLALAMALTQAEPGWLGERLLGSLYLLPGTVAGADWQQAATALAGLPADDPRRGVLAAARLVLRDNGNVFLDCAYDDGENDLDWFADFDWVREHWQTTGAVLDEADRFADWLSLDPVRHCREVLDCAWGEAGNGGG